MPVYYTTFLRDIIFVLGCHWEAFDGDDTFEVDLDTYLTTNILDTFTETLSIRYHHMDVTVFVADAGITAPGTGVGLCVAVSRAVLGFESGDGPCGLFAPG